MMMIGAVIDTELPIPSGWSCPAVSSQYSSDTHAALPTSKSSFTYGTDLLPVKLRTTLKLWTFQSRRKSHASVNNLMSNKETPLIIMSKEGGLYCY